MGDEHASTFYSTRQRSMRELIGRTGVVLGTVRGVWRGEPCWQDVDMFFMPFRLEATPEFEAYRPMFDSFERAVRAHEEGVMARLKNPDQRSSKDVMSFAEIDAFRKQTVEAVRIRESTGEVWRPLSLHIDGECGVFRTTRIPCRWNGREWVVVREPGWWLRRFSYPLTRLLAERRIRRRLADLLRESLDGGH